MLITYDKEHRSIIDDGTEKVSELWPNIISINDLRIQTIEGKGKLRQSKALLSIYNTIDTKISSMNISEDFRDIMLYIHFEFYKSFHQIINCESFSNGDSLVTKTVPLQEIKLAFHLSD
jgi:hypothetical protein